MNTWTGTIGHVGKPTLDGCTIAQIRTDLERGVVPLEVYRGDPLELAPVGKVLAFLIDADGTITAAGTTTLEPGTYVPGLVLTDVENAEVLELGSQVCGGTLASVFVHPPGSGSAAAAWQDAKITVVAA